MILSVKRTALLIMPPLMLVAFLALASPPEMPEQHKARALRIEEALLAPCCYKEPVSRHQSEIAVKMRLEIARWVAMGRTDQEILDAYARQYGAKVLADPRTQPTMWMRWVPWLALILGAASCVLLLRRWRTRGGAGRPTRSDQLDSVHALPELDED